MIYLLLSLKTIVKSNAGKKMKGFSLIEMAIVLFIIALLLGGLLPTIGSQIEQQRRNETQKLLADIRESLLGYVIVNGRLPLPACGTVSSDSTYAGLELTPASAASPTYCPNSSDAVVLPWATLGVRETDGWGNRLTYQVTPKFASGVIGGKQTSFLIEDAGNITIKSSTTGNINANYIPVIVISHGIKGCGAYRPTGLRVNDDPAAIHPAMCNDMNQQENSDYDSDFISQTNTPTFDDLVVWLSTITIVNRMVTIGKLP